MPDLCTCRDHEHRPVADSCGVCGCFWAPPSREPDLTSRPLPRREVRRG